MTGLPSSRLKSRIERARAGDDPELLKLVREDPYYLGTELLIQKVILWRLQVLQTKVKTDARRLARTAGIRDQRRLCRRDATTSRLPKHSAPGSSESSPIPITCPRTRPRRG